MKALFIGGTGTISMAITKKLLAEGHEVYLLNRGNRNADLQGNVHFLNVDVNDEKAVLEKIDGLQFDVVAEFIAFVPSQLERDYRLFKGRTKQFIFISSASAYQKPVGNYVISEKTPLANPYWEYSRNKIACEELLMKYYREEGFPVTIVRPSHTYSERSIPVGIHGRNGSWQVIKRMMEGKPVLVHGDGTSLWTMTFNEDFAKGFIGLIGNPHAIGEAFQIMSDESLTWNQIYKAIADALGVPFKPYYASSDFIIATQPEGYDMEGNLIGDKANSVVFDCSKLKRAVPGFQAVVRYEEGVRRCLKYMTEHKECQQEDHVFDQWCDRVIETLEKAKNNF